jgi:aminoglycoside phosphotransferase (APT) family kinase protein
MQLDATNAEQYLRSRAYLAPGETVQARELSGGVSNVVIYVERTGGDNLVLKQAREQLRVEQPWFCSIDRIWREVDVLGICHRIVTQKCGDSPLAVEVPHLLFEDRDNYLYAMSAAPPEHDVWKTQLLSGVARKDIAHACGVLLGNLHAATWHNADVAARLDDRQFFDDLRLDPYYREIARVHVDIAPAISRMIESVWNERHTLVHGDFSPKNLLIHGDRLVLIDFEVGHYGDPAFDLGFFLTHLMLKAFYHAPLHKPYFDLIHSFWSAYCAQLAEFVPREEMDALVGRAVLNFAGCSLARLDGKSKVDYINDIFQRDQIRHMCRTIFLARPRRWDDVMLLAADLIAASLNTSRISKTQSHS